MTTIDAAAAWRVKKPVVLAAFVAFIGFGLAGCETSTGLFGNTTAQNGTLGQPGADPAASATPAATRTAKVGVAPVIGAPEVIGKSLQAQLTSAIEAQRVTVAKESTDAAEFVVRGYVVSANDKSRTKVSYIWDVTDQSGKRVNRITGEEVVQGSAKDPWSAVTPAVISNIATKTAGSLGAWLPTQNAAAVAQSPVPAQPMQPVAAQAPFAGAPQQMAQAPAQPSPMQAPQPTSQAQQQRMAAAQPQPTSAPGAQQPIAQTGSIDRAPVSAVVAGVTGAPGDGSVALSSALQRELQRSGVALADQAAAPSAYRVEGNVVVGQINNGKQPIQIDWTLKDPAGKKLGSVSQKNEVPQGSLDGAWGRTADAAAAAAAQGLLKLIPQQTRTQ